MTYKQLGKFIKQWNIASSDDGICHECPLIACCEFRLKGKEAADDCYQVLAHYLLDTVNKDKNNEANKNKEVKSTELRLTLKEQLNLKSSERLEKIKEEREIKHQLWLKNNTELIDYFKGQLLKTAENTGAKAETVLLDNGTLTDDDINEIYYYFEKEGIRVSGQGFAPVKEDIFGNKSITYTSLRFSWED